MLPAISALPWGFSLLEVTITRGNTPGPGFLQGLPGIVLRRQVFHDFLEMAPVFLRRGEDLCPLAALWAIAGASGSSDLAVAR